MRQQIERGGDSVNPDPRGSRRPRHQLWVLAVIIAMALAAIAGVAITKLLTRPPTNALGTTVPARDRMDSPLEATQEYLEAMKVNDRARAHAVVCSTRHADPFGSGPADPMLDHYRILTEASNDGAIATTTVTLTYEPSAADVGDVTVRFTVVNELGAWHVCGVEQIEP